MELYLNFSIGKDYIYLPNVNLNLLRNIFLPVNGKPHDHGTHIDVHNPKIKPNPLFIIKNNTVTKNNIEYT